MNFRPLLPFGVLPFILGGFLSAQTYVCEPLEPGGRPILRPASPFRLDPACMLADQVVLKFRDSHKIRLVDGRLEDGGSADLRAVHRLLTGTTIERLFTRPEGELDAERHAGNAAIAAEGEPPLADLNNYYRIKTNGREATEELVNALNRLAVVETAYPLHVTAMAGDLAPETPRYMDSQRYLRSAPEGLGFLPLQSLTGARFQGGSVAHVEGNWIFDHEDLARFGRSSLIGATPNTYATRDWTQHGTACLGILAGERNAYGIQGLASGASRVRVCSLENGAANSINLTAGNLGAGGVMSSSWGWVVTAGRHAPLDLFQAEYDAVRSATARGVFYTFSAGNSSMSLEDASTYGGRYAPGAVSSGGFIIGATAGANLVRASFSNYGSRVDANGWGMDVMTTGYGATFHPGGDDRQSYTRYFNGTSAAAPMVAGVIASYIGAVRIQNGLALTPAQVRADLRSTGTAIPNGLIGTRPDLAALLARRGLPDGLLVARPASLGGTASLEVSGEPGAMCWLLSSLAPGNTPSMLNRPLLLDQSAGITLLAAPINLGAPAVLNIPIPIPNSPAMTGAQFEVQSLQFGAQGLPRLSNSVEIWVDPRGTNQAWGFQPDPTANLWQGSFAGGTSIPDVGDFNGDGKDDIVSFVRGSNALVHVALSNGTGFGTPRQWHSHFAVGTETPRVGDFNGDGRDDIVTFVQGARLVYVALSNGTAFVPDPFANLWHTDFAEGTSWPDVGDFNGDGRDDIIMFHRGGAPRVEVALSTGSSFGARQTWHGFFAHGDEYPAIGDFDGDGTDDIITFRRADGNVFVALSNRTSFGTTGHWHRFFCIQQEVPGIGDFDGNGKADAAAFLRGGNPLVYVTTSDGRRLRAAEVWHHFFALGSEIPKVGDFNGDGKDDIVTFLRGSTPRVYVATSR